MSCGLRDVISFEESGRPGVLVASSVFAQAAEAQQASAGGGNGAPESDDEVIEDAEVVDEEAKTS